MLFVLFLCRPSAAQVFIPTDSALSWDRALQRQQEYEPPWLIGGGFGFGYRLAKLPEGLNSLERDYYKKLKSGYFYQFNGTYYFKHGFGIGLTYNSFVADNEIKNVTVSGGPPGFNGTGIVSDDITISYFGLNGNFRYWNAQHIGFAVGSFGIGYMKYKDDAIVIKPFTITGKTFGVTFGGAYYFGLSPDFWLGAYAGYFAGILTQYDFYDGKTTQTVKLPDLEAEGLHHITLGLQAAFAF